jgi:hypothetical protein
MRVQLSDQAWCTTVTIKPLKSGALFRISMRGLMSKILHLYLIPLTTYFSKILKSPTYENLAIPSSFFSFCIYATT